MIRPAQKIDSTALARLHAETLTTSFLASLGQAFLRNLYTFLIQKEKVWVFEEESRIKGFVSFSANSSGMMKRFIIQCPACLLILLFKTFARPANLKRFAETFRAPFQSENVSNSVHIPSGELLSISVSPDCQASGIGSQLVEVLESYLKEIHISNYKVVAGEELVGANKFYIRNGFVLVQQIRIHGESVSNVYVKELQQIASLRGGTTKQSHITTDCFTAFAMTEFRTSLRATSGA